MKQPIQHKFEQAAYSDQEKPLAYTMCGIKVGTDQWTNQWPSVTCKRCLNRAAKMIDVEE